MASRSAGATVARRGDDADRGAPSSAGARWRAPRLVGRPRCARSRRAGSTPCARYTFSRSGFWLLVRAEAAQAADDALARQPRASSAAACRHRVGDVVARAAAQRAGSWAVATSGDVVGAVAPHQHAVLLEDAAAAGGQVGRERPRRRRRRSRRGRPPPRAAPRAARRTQAGSSALRTTARLAVRTIRPLTRASVGDAYRRRPGRGGRRRR